MSKSKKQRRIEEHELEEDLRSALTRAKQIAHDVFGPEVTHSDIFGVHTIRTEYIRDEDEAAGFVDKLKGVHEATKALFGPGATPEDALDYFEHTVLAAREDEEPQE